VDREKLDKILDHAERQKVLEEITVHMETLETLVKSGEFDIFCDDYLNHNGLGVCEAFALQADLLNLTQQLPGVLNAHGLKSPGMLSRLLKQGLRKNPLIDVLADGANTNNELPPLLTQLKALAGDQNTLTEERLNGAGLSSISALAQQLTQEEGDSNTGSDELAAIKLDRVFASVKEAADIADPNLGGIARQLPCTDRPR